MQMSSVQGRPAIVPVRVSALPPGVRSITNIDVKRNELHGGYIIIVQGEANSAAVKVSLGKPKVAGSPGIRNVNLVLKATGSELIGAAVVTPFTVSAKVARLTDISVITIENAKGERIDSRIVTLVTPPMRRGTRDV